jgi:hypothetical protein
MTDAVDAVWTKLQELWAGVWIALQELWADTPDALRGAVLGALIASLTALVIHRKTTRHQWRLEEARREQDRREGVHRDLLTLIEPVSQWLHESKNNDTQGVPPSPPKLDDSLQVKVNVGLDLDNQLAWRFWNTSRWWWSEWMDAYKNVVRIAEENEPIPPIPLMRLENAEIRLRRSFDPNRDKLIELKKMYLHGVMFLNEPTVSEQLWDIFERVVERVRSFRRGFAERAEMRRLARQETPDPHGGAESGVSRLG